MALTADRVPKQKAAPAARTGRRGVAAAVVIYLNALIGKNAAGYIVPATDSTAVSIIGVSEQHVDNAAGAAGAKTCAYKTAVEVELDNAGGAITVANLGRGCYVASDAGVTTRAVSAAKVYVGVVQEFTAAKVWVFVDEAISGVLDDLLVHDPVAAPVNSAAAAQAATPGTRRTYALDIPNTATITYRYLLADKQEIIDTHCIKDVAGAGNTLQLTDGADAAISDAMAFAVDKTITRAATLDKAKRTVAAGGEVKVVATNNAGSLAGQLFIDTILRA